jgi:hypothetical protein
LLAGRKIKEAIFNTEDTEEDLWALLALQDIILIISFFEVHIVHTFRISPSSAPHI